MEQMEAPVPNISPTKEEEIKGLKDFNIKADEENYVLKLGKLNDSKKIVLIQKSKLISLIIIINQNFLYLNSNL